MSEGFMLFLFFGILVFFLMINMPVAYAIGVTCVVLMFLGVARAFSPELLASRMFFGLNNFSILAIPFFLFAGRIMNYGGMTTRIFDFAKALVGGLKGGVGHVNIVASMIFAGMSGLATADAAGLGAIEYRAMKEGGYPDGISVGLAGASATIGAIFPPSVPGIMFAIIANVSVGWMLLGGIMPGIMIGLVLIATVTYQSYAGHLPYGEKFSWPNIWDKLKRGYLALGTPLILIGGIITGVFTPTEAAAVAVFYALILALFVYKEIPWPSLWQILKATTVDATTVAALMGIAAIYGFLIVESQVPAVLANQILNLTDNVIILLLLINLVLIFAGMFMETIVILFVFIPILLPVAVGLGMHPIHFGIMMVYNLQIGLLTPPMGLLLFVLNKATGVDLRIIVRGTLIYYVPLVVCLLIVTFWPQLTLWIPSLVFGN